LIELRHDLSPERIFLTGEPGCGKTTVMKRVAESLTLCGLKIGGVMSIENRDAGRRTGFSLEDLMTHETGMLAGIGFDSGPRVGRYTVDILDLDRIGAQAVQRATKEAEVILIDELGPMELYSSRFIEAVRVALRTQKHLLATVHKRANHALIVEVRANPAHALVEVTGANRDELPAQIIERIMSPK